MARIVISTPYSRQLRRILQQRSVTINFTGEVINLNGEIPHDVMHNTPRKPPSVFYKVVFFLMLLLSGIVCLASVTGIVRFAVDAEFRTVTASLEAIPMAELQKWISELKLPIPGPWPLQWATAAV